MNTPAHLVFGLAAFGRPGRPGLILAALSGALIPDASLYVLSGFELLRGTSVRIIFGELYFSDTWQAIFAVDNSIPLWTALLALGAALRRPWIASLAGAALLHLVFDLALHNDDARRHFWPLSNWVFVSPVSYWDPAHYGRIVAPVETAVTLALCASIWIRHHGEAWVRAAAALLGAAQLAPMVLWAVMFA